ncbi:MAG: hypothetical protein AABX37_05510 [Nanoarchaeota archaeon]
MLNEMKSAFGGKKKIIAVSAGAIGSLVLSAGIVFALVGDLLDTVGLPGNGDCSVAGTFTGKYYMTMKGGFVVGCAGSTLQIYTPPAPDLVPGLPPDPATLVSTKSIVDAADGATSVSISALAWDPTRGKVWGAYADKVYLIDVGDPTVGGLALATFKFSPSATAPAAEVDPFDPFGKLPGITLVDGMAYDDNNDSVWYSPDVHCNAYNFAADGTYLGKVTPKNAAGVSDCSVSGVVVGSANTLYIGRNGASEIRRVDKTTGAFVSSFATTVGRVEDLTCDPVTYAPKEAILAKDAYGGPAGDPTNVPRYEAFEVEEGTCPLPTDNRRMTGGGSVFTANPGRVTHGFELHCDVSNLPNRLEVNWGKGNKFHLESLTSALCFDDPVLDEEQPVAGFDTYKGKGTGRYNGVSGATAEWKFTDDGEPGTSDHVTLEIKDVNSAVVLTVSGVLDRGNHQAHAQ